MKRGKTIVGLLVLCALIVSAFGTGSAAAAKGTTAGECSSTAAKKDFSDAHCDNSVAEGTFGHTLFTAGEEVKYTVSNNKTGTETTPAKLHGTLGGISSVVECTTVTGSGTVKNNNTSPMTVTFGKAVVKFEPCRVVKPPACEGAEVKVASTEVNVSDPMTMKEGTVEKTDLTGNKYKAMEETGGSEMGLKFTPPSGTFTTVTFPASCPEGVRGAKPVKGVAYGTPNRASGSKEATLGSGATLKFDPAGTLPYLTLGGNAAQFEATLTLRKEGGNPLVLTTTEP